MYIQVSEKYDHTIPNDCDHFYIYVYNVYAGKKIQQVSGCKMHLHFHRNFEEREFAFVSDLNFR